MGVSVGEGDGDGASLAAVDGVDDGVGSGAHPVAETASSANVRMAAAAFVFISVLSGRCR